jgi:hypothetical protein
MDKRKKSVQTRAQKGTSTPMRAVMTMKAKITKEIREGSRTKIDAKSMLAQVDGVRLEATRSDGGVLEVSGSRKALQELARRFSDIYVVAAVKHYSPMVSGLDVEKRIRRSA